MTLCSYCASRPTKRRSGLCKSCSQELSDRIVAVRELEDLRYRLDTRVQEET